jgi:Ca2+/Na+ antiporter
MNPIHKTLLIILSSILGMFIFPLILIIFHDYIYAFLAVTLFLACFVLFGYCSYQELLPIIQQEQLEEERIFHSFNGDPEKIRFYKGFKKHFDGELNLKELERWFINHPRKHT